MREWRGRRSGCWVGVCAAAWIAAATLGSVAPAQDPPPSRPPAQGERTGEPLVTTTVGMEASYLYRHRGGRLEAVPFRRVEEGENVPPFLLWILDRVVDGESTIYEFRFTGNVPGDYDLRDHLQDAEGRPATDVPPLLVRVESVLPPDHDGVLSEVEDPPLPRLGGYRTLLWILGIAWAIPVVWWILRALWRRRPRAVEPPPAVPTLADQLRPLVEAAVRSELDPVGQARLERMLLAHWRARLEIHESSFLSALRRLKADPTAGALLRGLEEWLHRPGGGSVDVEALLAPYRGARPVTEGELSTAAPAGGGVS